MRREDERRRQIITAEARLAHSDKKKRIVFDLPGSATKEIDAMQTLQKIEEAEKNYSKLQDKIAEVLIGKYGSFFSDMARQAHTNGRSERWGLHSYVYLDTLEDGRTVALNYGAKIEKFSGIPQLVFKPKYFSLTKNTKDAYDKKERSQEKTAIQFDKDGEIAEIEYISSGRRPSVYLKWKKIWEKYKVGKDMVPEYEEREVLFYGIRDWKKSTTKMPFDSGKNRFSGVSRGSSIELEPELFVSNISHILERIPTKKLE